MKNVVLLPEVVSLIKSQKNPWPVYALVERVRRNWRVGDLAALNADDAAVAAVDAGIAVSKFGYARVALGSEGNVAFSLSYVSSEASNLSWVFNFDAREVRTRAEFSSFRSEQMRLAREHELEWAHKVIS